MLIVLVGALANRTGIASPLLLLAVGAGAGYLPFVQVHGIEPRWILDGVLPPLLYASAVNLPFTDLRRNLRPIAGLAVVLVVISTIGSGLALHALLPAVGLFSALAVGAVVSPTDAVAATSIAKRLGLPERVLAVLEGESLLNDATALTLLAAAVGAAASGTVTAGAVALQFGYAVVVAVAVGLVVGLLSVELRARLGDPVLTTTISFVVPFAAYFPAEGAGASGLLATVVAGLVTGIGGRRRFDGTQRVNDATNWRTVQFVLEQGVFLAMGLQLHGLIDDLLDAHGDLLDPVVIGAALVGVLLVLRAVYVATEGLLLSVHERRLIAAADEAVEDAGDERARRRAARRRADADALRESRTNWRGGVVIVWSGMRGVVTLAGAQTLPRDTPERPLLVLVAFVVAVISLLGFGGTLPAVIRASGVRGADAEERRGELHSLMRQIFAAGIRVLDDPEQTVVDGERAPDDVLDHLRSRYSRLADAADSSDPERMTNRQQAFVLRRRIRDAARSELQRATATGGYSSGTVAQAQRLLDTADAREDDAGAGR